MSSEVPWWFLRRSRLGFEEPLEITSLVPDTLPSNPGFYMTINGTGFKSGALGYFEGLNLPTTIVSDNELSCWVPGGVLTVPGSYPVYVRNLDGEQSSTLFFTVT